MRTNHNQKILIVSYHFPPDSRVGAIRPAKFAKYLSRFGWQPYVLTIKEKYIPHKDYERLEEVHNVKIIRTAVWPTVILLLLRIRHKIIYFFKRGKNNIKYSDSFISADSSNGKKANPGILRSFISPIKSKLLLLLEFPDRDIGWLIPAVWKGYRLIRKEKINIIMISSPPRSIVVVGLILSKLTGAKLLTDLRDPWIEPEELWQDRLPSKENLWLENKFMKRSHKVITTTECYTSFLKNTYHLIEDKFHTIHNGYDREDFIGLEAVKPNGKFTLSYFGAFYIGRTPKEFLLALRQLLENNAIPRGEVQVNFFGNVRFANEDRVEDLVKSYGLTECVTLRDTLPYKEALLQMKRSDVLLLFAPDEQYYAIPGKAFEYIGAGGSILCIGNKGATADLIRKTESGIVVDMNDVDEIRDAVKELYLCWKSGEKLGSNCDRKVFEREELTRQLLQLLQS